MLGMNHRGKRKRFNDNPETNRNLRDRLYLDGPDLPLDSPQASTPVDVIQSPPPLPTLGSTQPEYVDHVERVNALERYVADAEAALSSALAQVDEKEQRIANLEARLGGGLQAAVWTGDASSSPDEVLQAVGALEHYVSEAERVLSTSLQTIQEKDRGIEALEVELETLRLAEDRLREEQAARLQQQQEQQHQLDQLRHQLNESQGHLAEAQKAAAHHQHALDEAVAASNAKQERLQALEAELHQSRAQADTSHHQIQERVRHMQQRLENLLQGHAATV